MANRVSHEQKKILLRYVTYKDVTCEDGKTKERWTCGKCHHTYAGRPNRIVSHLLWRKDKGASPCEGMKDAQERENLEKMLRRNSQSEQLGVRMSQGALLEGDHNGVEETDAAGSEMVTTTHQGQYSQPDTTQTSVSQGGMHISMGNLIPNFRPHQVSFDQHTHPLQGGVGIDIPGTSGNRFGVGMTDACFLAGEPQPPCPPGFDSDLWKFYLEIDIERNSRFSGNFALYKECISSTNEEDRNLLLDCLESACDEVRHELTYFTMDDGSSYEYFRDKFHLLRIVKKFSNRVRRVEEMRNEIKGQREGGVEVLGTKKNDDMERWLKCADTFQSGFEGLDLDVEKAKSPGEIRKAFINKSPEQGQLLLMRIENLTKVADILIEKGTSLLNPIFLKDFLYWSWKAGSCGSQLQSHTSPGHCPQEV